MTDSTRRGSAEQDPASAKRAGPAAAWRRLRRRRARDAGLLTLRAAALLGQADLVVASAGAHRPARAPAAGHGGPSATRLSWTPTRGCWSRRPRPASCVVRLFDGDPLLFGQAAAEAAACAKARIRFEIVPGRARRDRRARLRRASR